MPADWKKRTALTLAAINKKPHQRLAASTFRCDRISSIDVSEIGLTGSYGGGRPVPLSLKNLKRKSNDKRNNDVLLFAHLIYISSGARARGIWQIAVASFEKRCIFALNLLQLFRIILSMAGTYDFDLIVIGSGPAGEKGAAQAAYFGKKTAIIEKAPRVGGAGVNTGTVPSKTLRETALYFSNLRQRGLYGIDYSVKQNISIEDFMYRKTHVVNNEWDLIYQNIERHNIELIFGHASFLDAHTIQVERDGAADRYTAEVFLIATGSIPNRPDNFPIDDHLVVRQRLRAEHGPDTKEPRGDRRRNYRL